MTNKPLQDGLDAINTAIYDKDDKTQLIGAKCRALLRGYAVRWADSNYIPCEVEQISSADLTNPITGRKSRDLRIAGKKDVVANRVSIVFGNSQKRTLIDHKTTSDDITDPAGAYWRQLVVESQPSHYMLLDWLNGVKIDEAVWDVIKKPSISPRALKSKAEHASVVANRTYYNHHVTEETLAHLQVSDRENLEMYEARLFHDCTKERPQYYFQRKTVPRLDSELIEYASELWDAGQLILEARRKNRWPKHPGSCMCYNSPCKYLGICSNQDTPTSTNWKAKDQTHAELSAELDRNTMTNSSVRMFQTCPRKFYYSYEIGIERVDEEEREALLTGHIMHLGLEAYWRALMPEENDDGNSDSTGGNSLPSDCASQAAYAW